MTQQNTNTSVKWPPYPVYHLSDLPWLGDVPEYWEVKQVKRIFIVTNGSTPNTGIADFWDGDIVWITPEDLGQLRSDTIYGSARRITRDGYQSCGTTLVPPGSLVLSTRAPIGHLAIGGVELCTNQGCRCLVFRRNGNSRFFYYQFLAARPELESYGRGSTFKELGKSELEAVRIVCPPLPEQQAITTFLDRQTTHLDDLIAKNRRLIELLQEKRAALISQAVTKGLNPDVPKKDSGMAWLGTIPAHWQIIPLKFAVRQRPGAIKTGPFGSQLLSSEMTDGEIKVYNQRNVIDQDFESGDNYINKVKYEELKAFTVFPGDILLTTRGTIGRCAILPENAETGILHPCLMRIQPDSKLLLAKYLAVIIQDSYLLRTQLFLMSDATTIDVVYSDTMKQVVIPFPPMEEQENIINYIDYQANHLDALIAHNQSVIEKLQEYRTALISAAVTGKIDVRNRQI